MLLTYLFLPKNEGTFGNIKLGTYICKEYLTRMYYSWSSHSLKKYLGIHMYIVYSLAKLLAYRTLSSPGRNKDLTWMKHKRPLQCVPNHESLEFFRGFHLSELGMDVPSFWSIVTRCVHPLFKWDLCSSRVKTKSGMPKAWVLHYSVDCSQCIGLEKISSYHE